MNQTRSQELNPATMNRLIYGDNLLAMAALLAGNEQMPSMRGKIDLIYIDPPFDSKADYATKINLKSTDIEQRPAVIEQFAYSDTWKDGRASYLEMLVPRLVLMREMLSGRGSIYVHVGWQVASHVKVVMDEIFGMGGGGSSPSLRMKSRGVALSLIATARDMASITKQFCSFRRAVILCEASAY